MKKIRIEVFPSGRLGNQLFQIAALVNVIKAVSKNGQKKYLVRWHTFEPETSLLLRKIPYLEVKRHHIMRFVLHSKYKLAERGVLARGIYSIWWRIQQKNAYKIPNLKRDFSHSLQGKSKILLTDYHQDYNWVDDFINYFEFDLSRNTLSTNLLEQVRIKKPIAIHMRFGDFLDSANRDYFGELGKIYYSAAITQIIENGNTKRNFWIFTDDPIRAKEKIDSIGLKNFKFVKDFNLTLLEELILLSACPDIIISNSTFSWWGAYLGQSHARIFSPNPLFKKGGDYPAYSPTWRKVDAYFE